MQVGGPPLAGVAHTPAPGQSAVRAHVPPAATHSPIPSPQRSTQLAPLGQSAAVRHTPYAPHSENTVSGTVWQVTRAAQSAFASHAPRAMHSPSVSPSTSRQIPRSVQASSVAQRVGMRTQNGTPTPLDWHEKPNGHISIAPQRTRRSRQLPDSHAKPDGQSRESEHPLARTHDMPVPVAVQALPAGQSDASAQRAPDAVQCMPHGPVTHVRPAPHGVVLQSAPVGGSQAQKSNAPPSR